MFNPIIPVSTALPPAWRQEHFKEITGQGLADAYIRFFEPDVFVEAEAGLAKEAGVADVKRFLSERTVPLRQFVRSEGNKNADFAFGLSALDIYKDLYQTEFKFVSRKRRKVAIFEDDNPYCEAVFGAFAHSKKLPNMKKAFVDVCEPEIFSATAENCLKLFSGGHLARNKQTTGLGHVTKEDLGRLQVVVPPPPIELEFNRIVGPTLDRIRAALFENRALAATRDALLPKLMSGEIRVKDAERIAEAAL
jgi:hypothetical protein